MLHTGLVVLAKAPNVVFRSACVPTDGATFEVTRQTPALSSTEGLIFTNCEWFTKVDQQHLAALGRS
jgi:hypothetical protein